jgi:hypothetical protein
MDGGHPCNPAELPLVTLDQNALVALRGDEPDAPAVRKLLDLNRVGLICVNVTMSTAMEAQQPKEQLEWQDLAIWIESFGIRREKIFTSSRSVGFMTLGEPNTMTFSPDAEKMLSLHFNQHQLTDKWDVRRGVLYWPMPGADLGRFRVSM